MVFRINKLYNIIIMPLNYITIGLTISFLMHGYHFVKSWMNNRATIVLSVSNIENDAIVIKDDIKDIIKNPSLENINKDVMDITQNVEEIASNVIIIEKTIIDIENDTMKN